MKVHRSWLAEVIHNVNPDCIAQLGTNLGSWNLIIENNGIIRLDTVEKGTLSIALGILSTARFVVPVCWTVTITDLEGYLDDVASTNAVVDGIIVTEVISKRGKVLALNNMNECGMDGLL